MINNNVTPEQLDMLVQTHPVVLIDFWAQWCAPCKQFESVYEEVSEQYPHLVFAKVDIEKQASLAETFEIRSIPHLIIFKDGMIIYSESGSMPKSRLETLVSQALAVEVK